VKAVLAAYAALAWVLVTYPLPGTAAEAAPTAANPELEARVQRVAEELRCLVCQNQTIADSNAELAQDLRREVRQMIERGASEAEVREFMVTRYGDFILYRPPFKYTTLLLWVGPFALLLGGAWILRRVVVARREAGDSAGLSSEEQARLRTLIGAEQGTERG
jgi:cytochrome c-type biogenesis protein CcmH